MLMAGDECTPVMDLNNNVDVDGLDLHDDAVAVAVLEESETSIRPVNCFVKCRNCNKGTK